MKFFWIVLLALILASSVRAAESGRVKITGDRVSLRAAPKINAVLMDRVMSGDLLNLKDNANPAWVGVAPPNEVDVWVKSEYIRDNKVVPARLNLRSGPSLNHEVVGVIQRGDSLTVRGEVGDWLRIAPPETTVVWVSRKYTDVIAAPKKPEVLIHVEPSPEPVAAKTVKSSSVVVVDLPQNPEEKPDLVVKKWISDSVQIVETVVQPEVNEVMVAAARTLKLPVTLTPDPDKAQGAEKSFSGILRSTEGGLSLLMDRRVESGTVCYVRGNTKQMKAYANLPLTITGKTYWAADLDLPIIVPVKIQILKPLEN